MRKKKNATIQINKLTHCPRCLYSLEGLPSDHQCPECGLHYDSNCYSFFTEKRYDLVMNITGFVMVVALLIYWIFYSNWKMFPMHSVCLLLNLPFLLLPAIVQYNKNRKMPYDCALSAEGIHFWYYGIFRKMIPWDQIEHISFDTLNTAKLKPDFCIRLFLRQVHRTPKIKIFVESKDDIESLLENARKRIKSAEQENV